MAKVEWSDCQISHLCWHVVPFCVDYLGLFRSICIRLGEMYTFEFCALGKVSWYSEEKKQNLLECWDFQSCHGIF